MKNNDENFFILTTKRIIRKRINFLWVCGMDPKYTGQQVLSWIKGTSRVNEDLKLCFCVLLFSFLLFFQILLTCVVFFLIDSVKLEKTVLNIFLIPLHTPTQITVNNRICWLWPDIKENYILIWFFLHQFNYFWIFYN